MTTVNNTTSTGTTTGTSSTSKTAQGQLDGNYADFLKLLTTQLKNQDPTQPLDSTQFTQQTIQLSGVQQQVNANSNLEKLISLQQTNQINSAVSYIGTNVLVDGSSATLSGGKAAFGYTLGSAAAETEITITDSTGQAVYTGTGEKSSGNHIFNWNGKGNGGTQLSDGKYTISVKAIDDKGNTVNTSTSTAGTVTAVTMNNGVPSLIVNNAQVDINKIISVTLPTNANTGTGNAK